MKKVTLLVLLIGTLFSGSKSIAQSDPYIGQIMMVPYSFVPRNWAECNGQVLSIAQNSALFSLIGTQYGGDGVTTFGLPDLRGRVPLGVGSGPGLTTTTMGEKKGTETNTLTTAQLPAHNHTVNAVLAEGNQNSPTGSLLADTKLLDKEYSNATTTTTMGSTMIGNTGNGQAVNNMQPSTTVRYVIATQGVYPTQQ